MTNNYTQQHEWILQIKFWAKEGKRMHAVLRHFYTVQSKYASRSQVVVTLWGFERLEEDGGSRVLEMFFFLVWVLVA